MVVVDSGSDDGSVDLARGSGARVHEIPPTEFHHGRTRNLGARHARGDLLVFTSQDAYAANEDWLATLTAPLRSDDTVAGVYGRQLPHDDGHTARALLPRLPVRAAERASSASRRRTISRSKPTLFSNVNSAMLRRTWEEFPFAEDIVMSEDQEWSRRVLLAGQSVVYEPDAAVYHSHAYSLGGAMRRFFDSGASSDRSYVGRRDSSSRRSGVPAPGMRGVSWRGSGQRGSGAGSRTRLPTSSRSSRGSSSGDVTGTFHSPSRPA